MIQLPDEVDPYPLSEYAEDLLMDLDTGKADEELQFRQHVYALGKLAGRAGRDCRSLAKYLWADSNKTSQEGSGIAASPPAIVRV